MKVLNVRIYPNEEQQLNLSKLFGCYRVVFNTLLDYKISEYQTNKRNVSSKELQKYFHSVVLKDSNKIFLKEFNSNILKIATVNIDTAFKNMFKYKKGFPKFKSKRNYKETVRFIKPTCISRSNLNNGKLNLTKNLKNIKLRTSDLYTSYLSSHNENIKSIYITKSKSGIYKASICIDSPEPVNKKQLHKTKNIIGLDMGIKSFIHTSDNQIYENINKVNKRIITLKKEIKKTQKRLSKKEKGSNNKNKERIKLAKYNEIVNNIKDNYLHNISSKIINENQVIVMEDLNVKGMMKNHKLAKSIQNVSLYEFKRQIEYKAKKYQKEFITIDRYFPSSKQCSKCGVKNKALKLSDRTYKCGCGLTMDRDLNAAINIKAEGKRILNKNRGVVSRNENMLVETPTVDDPTGNSMLKSSVSMKQELQTNMGDVSPKF